MASNALTRRLNRACKADLAHLTRRYALALAKAWDGLSLRQLAAQNWPPNKADLLAAGLIALAGSEARAIAALEAVQRQARRKVIDGTADPECLLIGSPPKALQRLYDVLPDADLDTAETWADLIALAQRYGLDPDEVPL